MYKGGLFPGNSCTESILKGRVIFLVINYFFKQHTENVPISNRKPQFTLKHLSPCQFHDHNKEKVTKLYMFDKTAKRNKKWLTGLL